MSEINYEVEVKRMVPDAFICNCSSYGIHVFFGHNSEYIDVPSDTVEQAWKSAYYHIKSQIK